MSGPKGKPRRTHAKTPTRVARTRLPPGAAEAAEKAAGQAKARGAVGRHVTDLQRQLRDTAIMARLAAGWSTEMCAAEFEITQRQVERIRATTRRLPSGLDESPGELLEELLVGYRVAVSDFEAMAHRYAEAHPPVALGAKRAAVDARQKYQVMLDAVGKLPANLELFRAESELLRLGNLVLDELGRAERGELSPAEACARVRDALERGELPSGRGIPAAP